MTESESAELAAWAEARLPGLIDEACAATVERIPFYRDEQIVPADELRRSIEHNSNSTGWSVAKISACGVRIRTRRFRPAMSQLSNTAVVIIALLR